MDLPLKSSQTPVLLVSPLRLLSMSIIPLFYHQFMEYAMFYCKGLNQVNEGYEFHNTSGYLII